MKRLIGLALVAATTFANAQSTAIPGAPASAAKKELIQRLLVIQQPALESMTRDLIERPARQMMGAAEEALETRVAPEKRPEAVKKIQDLLAKYRDETTPIVKDRAAKIGQASLGPVFEEKYTEDELKQLLAALEAPAYKKFQQSLPELTNTYAQSVVKDLEPTVQPKIKALEQGVASALGVTAPAAAAPAKPGAKPAAPAASRPAKK
ncbi:MAG: hypothetical protein ABW190_00890 [Rhizobacter sp.]